MEIKEIRSGSFTEFKLNVTEIIKKIIGEELVQFATTTVMFIEDFEDLSEKQKDKLRARAKKYAEEMLECSDFADLLCTPGDGVIEITFVNGKKIFLNGTGGEAVQIATEDAYNLKMDDLI
jgi:hypothetical protein